MEAFPAPDLIFRKFAESAIDKPLKRRIFLSLLKVFGISSYAEKSRQKMISLAERGINPFDIDTVPNIFSGVYPEFSFSILFDKSNDATTQRAAKLAFAALEYRQSLINNSLEKETSGEAVIDNYRNHNLFGRVANIRKSGLKWNKNIKDCKNSSHIIIAVNGTYYKLVVIDSSGTTIAAKKLLHDIDSIVHAGELDRKHSKSYGLITTNIAWPSADIFYADGLDESIRAIDEALFLLAIDNNSFPADANEAGQYLHIRNHHNRDYRKSLQLVVLQNGFSGATFNLFAEIEGVVAARFASWIDLQARASAPIVAEETQNGFSRLEFNTIDFGKLPLAKLQAKITTYSCDQPLIKTIDAIGKEGIKQLNVSPDAFFHVAAHLAYYEEFKKIPSMHNLVDMRGIKFGSITRYPSTTGELAEFLEHRTKSNLLKAFDAHKKKISMIKSGDYPLHYVFHYLYTSVGAKPLLGIILFKLFVPDLLTKHISPDIWASNIPALPGIYCLGRFGTFFKISRKQCLAGHYLLFPDHIKICFLSNEGTFLESWRFDRSLKYAMGELKRILS